MIENGEVKEIKENTMIQETYVEISIIYPMKEFSYLTTYQKSVVLFSMQKPKIHKEYP